MCGRGGASGPGGLNEVQSGSFRLFDRFSEDFRWVARSDGWRWVCHTVATACDSVCVCVCVCVCVRARARLCEDCGNAWN